MTPNIEFLISTCNLPRSTPSYMFGQFLLSSCSLNSRSDWFSLPVAQRFLADHSAQAGQLNPVDPFLFDPVIDSGAADACDLYRSVNRHKVRLSLAVFAEKARYVLHDGTYSPSLSPVSIPLSFTTRSCTTYDRRRDTLRLIRKLRIVRIR